MQIGRHTYIADFQVFMYQLSQTANSKNHCSSISNPVCKIWRPGHCSDLLVLRGCITTTLNIFLPLDTLSKQCRSSSAYTQCLSEHSEEFAKNKFSLQRLIFQTKGVQRFEDQPTYRERSRCIQFEHLFPSYELLLLCSSSGTIDDLPKPGQQFPSSQ